MKKMPLVVIAVLILLVVISGITDSGDIQGTTGVHEDHEDHHGVTFYSDFEHEPHEDGYSIVNIVENPVPRDETAFLEENIVKSEEMVVRLEGVLTGLKENGHSNPELEERINDYSADVSEARNYLSMAENSSSKSESKDYLKLSRDSIIRANLKLKPIFDDVKAYLPGPVKMYNNALSAKGSGIVILSGDLDVEFFLYNGRFSVVDFSGDTVIDMEYDFDMEEMPEKGPDDDLLMPHEVLSYLNVTGNVSVSGSEYTVAMMAEDIIIDASGTGEAELVGNGTYLFDNGTAVEENSWAKPIFENR
ncbi:MAG: hypothetical protein R2741_02160 [Methanolobus sp.]